MELVQVLKEFVAEGQDWERKGTSVKGVSVIKLPSMTNRPASLALDINPLNGQGLPIKKRGMMIMNAVEFAAFKETFSNLKLDNLIKAIEEV